ncbi:MAG TPA: AAA family ATPase [Paenalcaligenes sp.]|nr:AAA family ATPase [Paenalcaligenes sp.]
MRILSLRFQNLNALVGEWSIDFTHPAYEAEGIFAITGPTGAGKTTILDAICLALYGRTPRLGAITQSSNEIMSRHTGECFAEVVFATQAGRFRCFWGQHRARRRPEGTLQPARHELADSDSGVLIANGIQAVQQQIPALTGLDFERFTRSMLLAQGSFAAFLQADADERAPLLEQITGTEIYAEISILVHEKRRDVQAQYQAMLSQTEKITLLDAAEEAALQGQLEHYQQLIKANETRLTQLQEGLHWHQKIEQLKEELQELQGQEQQLTKRINQFEPARLRLQWAEKALSFEEDYAALCALSEHIEQQTLALEKDQRELPALEQQYHSAQSAHQQAQQEWQAEQQRQEEFQTLWGQVQRLDEQLAVQQPILKAARADKEKRHQKLSASKSELGQLHRKQSELRQALQEIEQYQQKHAADAQLNELLGTLALHIEQIQRMAQQQQVLNEKRAQAQTAHQQQRAALAALKERYQAQRQQRDHMDKALQTAQRDLHDHLQGDSLRGLRQQLDDAREKHHLRRLMADFETHRAALQQGEPCPLCGALEHPLVTEALPSVDDYQAQVQALKQSVQQAESLQEQVQRLDAQLRNAQDTMHGLQNEWQEQRARVDLGEQEVNHVQAQTQALDEEYEQLYAQLKEQLQPFGVSLCEATDWAQLAHSLRERATRWQRQQTQAQKWQEQLSHHDIQRHQLQNTLANEQAELDEAERRLESVERHVQALQDQRVALFGDQTIAQSQAKRQALLQASQQQAEQAEKMWQQAKNDWSLKRESIQQQHTQRQTTQALEAKRKEALIAAIQEAGFTGWEDYQACRLPTSKRQALQRQAQTLDEEQIRLQSTRKERALRLAQEQDKALTTQTQEQLSEALAQCKAEQQAHYQKHSELGVQLRANEQAKQQLHQQREAALKQQKKLERWSALHDLIGSSDGKKFRNFAQGLSFAQLVYYANQQMQNMSERYLLQQDRANPLLLNVIDNYQGGIVRSTQNLSGGESFIVSLALALGLSQMASHNVRIDSLFLDEGFGTLDEEALSLALDALANLRHESKLIGVISHVSTLKERIGTQIEVVANQRGHSRLIGPGCQQLA